VGQALATEAIAECVRGGGVREAESSIFSTVCPITLRGSPA
jgi:hypothetical protein